MAAPHPRLEDPPPTGLSFVAPVALLGVSVARTDSPGQFALQLAVCPPVQLMPVDTDIVGLKLNLPYGHNRFVRGFDLGVIGSAEQCEALQLDLFNVVPARAMGMQIGAFNLAGDFEGVQIGLFNRVEKQSLGLQAGLLNVAYRVTGVQVGVVYHCAELWGVQIGLANSAGDAGFPFTVLLNASL